MQKNGKSRLGRGLDALFVTNSTEEDDSKDIETMAITQIEPNRNQPRKVFDEKALAELADSISQHGVLQPLIVRPMTGGNYQIIAGERRWRACRMAGVSQVPVIIKNLTETQAMQIALIENLQREDLSPVEEAKGYKALIETCEMTQEEVSKSVGKSRPYITNTMRLLGLPEEVLDMVTDKLITAGHARTLLGLEDKAKITELAKLVAEKGVSVRELENTVKKLNAKSSQNDEIRQKKVPIRKSFFTEVEIALNDHLSRKVKVVENAKGDKGVLQIEFYSEDDLNDLAKKFL